MLRALCLVPCAAHLALWTLAIHTPLQHATEVNKINYSQDFMPGEQPHTNPPNPQTVETRGGSTHYPLPTTHYPLLEPLLKLDANRATHLNRGRGAPAGVLCALTTRGGLELRLFIV